MLADGLTRVEKIPPIDLPSRSISQQNQLLLIFLRCLVQQRSMITSASRSLFFLFAILAAAAAGEADQDHACSSYHRTARTAVGSIGGNNAADVSRFPIIAFGNSAVNFGKRRGCPLDQHRSSPPFSAAPAHHQRCHHCHRNYPDPPREAPASAALPTTRKRWTILFASPNSRRSGSDSGERNRPASSTSQSSSSSPSAPSFPYSDDCFGLIALSSGAAAHDYAFALTFVGISAAAAIYATTTAAAAAAVAAADSSQPPPSQERFGKELPAAVAGLTLLAAPLVRSSWDQVAAVASLAPAAGNGDIPEWAPAMETAVCLFSMLYGFVLTRGENK